MNDNVEDPREILQLIADGVAWCSEQADRIGVQRWQIEQALDRFTHEQIEEMEGPSDLLVTPLEEPEETLH